MWNSIVSMFPNAKDLLQAIVANTVVIGVVGWLGKFWADKRIEAFKGEQGQRIEQLKGEQALKIEEVKGSQSAQLESIKGEIANLGRKFQANIEERMLVFKSHFDIEFKAYQDIWAKCDVAADLASMTLQYAQRVPVDKTAEEEERLDSIRRYDECREALAEVRKKRPFVTKEVSDSARSLLVQCVEITDLYRSTYRHMSRDASFDRKPLINQIKQEADAMGREYDRLADLISNRLSHLYVTDK